MPLTFPSATSRATLRQTLPISRSRFRTPASRVYSSMIARSAASVNEIWPRAEAVLLDLPGHQVALRDVELLVQRVAGEADHLHPVLSAGGTVSSVFAVVMNITSERSNSRSR